MIFDNISVKKQWSVSELTDYLKKKIEADFLLRNIILKGEMIKPNLSGEHLYFELKDLEYDVKIKCVFFWFNRGLEVKHGQKVLVKGNVIFYEKEGIVELKVNEITDIGLGEYYIKLKQLEERLKKEGFFDDKHKKKIPHYPKRVGIVTSKNGAAVRDILKTIYSKMDNLEVYIFDCTVQGQNAAYQICEGIEYFNSAFAVDVIIVGRGGGSFEDLMAFNDEDVLRKIFESNVPVISAVGHERDYVLSDYIADFRAITPTHAGEVIVFHYINAIQKLNENRERLKSAIKNALTHYKKDYNLIAYRLLQNSPSNLLAKMAQDVDIKYKRLYISMHKRLNQYKLLKGELFERLISKNPLVVLEAHKAYYNKMMNKLEWAIKDIFNRSNIRYNIGIEKLIALNPLNILKRGYSVTFYDSKVLTSVIDVNINDEVITYLKDGSFRSKIVDIKEYEDHARAK